eukprot:scaffold878_cov271-Pinguiococcus_pyrenoidosus.AAC.23
MEDVHAPSSPRRAHQCVLSVSLIANSARGAALPRHSAGRCPLLLKRLLHQGLFYESHPLALGSVASTRQSLGIGLTGKAQTLSPDDTPQGRDRALCGP